ncbi:hypothetical protein ACIHAX_28475 [Nocardia sp. NPDC051929]|uniref:hypothetical protein n=1 Tax=Nocardia sp. NPDC051929 TaxID=3364327 RepID=UPI0037CB30ED
MKIIPKPVTYEPPEPDSSRFTRIRFAVAGFELIDITIESGVRPALSARTASATDENDQ